MNDKLVAMFPSPCGDYGSYPFRFHPILNLFSGFRPLAGIMVLIIFM